MKKGIIALALVLSLYACKKDSTSVIDTPVTTIKVNDLAADTIIGITPGAPPTGGMPYGAGKFTFYSLENNKIIPNSDSASAKWDIGFRGTTIITNNGNSGPASGGAFVYIGLFDDLKTIHVDSVFKIDNAPTAYAITTGSNKGWYVYDGVNNLINPIPGRVLVIRTATGKFAKIEILNYYKGGITPSASATDDVKTKTQRYFTFRFSFQPNGTKVF